jgi:hypothetical protein
MNASSLFSGAASVITARPEGEAPPMEDVLSGTGGGNTSFRSELENHLQSEASPLPVKNEGVAAPAPSKLDARDEAASPTLPAETKTKDLAFNAGFRFHRPAMAVSAAASAAVKAGESALVETTLPLLAETKGESAVEEKHSEADKVNPPLLVDGSQTAPAYPSVLLQSMAVAEMLTPPPVPASAARPAPVTDDTTDESKDVDTAQPAKTQAEVPLRFGKEKAARATVASAQVLSLRNEDEPTSRPEVNATPSEAALPVESAITEDKSASGEPLRSGRVMGRATSENTKRTNSDVASAMEIGSASEAFTRVTSAKGINLASPAESQEALVATPNLLPKDSLLLSSPDKPRPDVSSPKLAATPVNEQATLASFAPGRNDPALIGGPAESSKPAADQIAVELSKDLIPTADSLKNYAKPRTKLDSQADNSALDPAGTAAAKTESAMSARKSVEWEKSASSLVYRAVNPLSERASGQADAELSRQVQMMLSQPDMPDSKASAVEAAVASSARTENKVADIEKLQTAFFREVRFFKQTGAESLRMVIEPSSDMRLSIHLQMTDGRVAAEMRCEQGDAAMLQSHWGELQTIMASQGVDLGDWSGQQNSNHQPQSQAEAKSNFLMDQGPRDERQREPVFQSVEERQNETARFNRFSAKTVREESVADAKQMALAGKLESWA